MRIEMIILFLFVVVRPADRSITKPRRPIIPALPPAVCHRAESRIVFDSFVVSNEFPEGGEPLRRRGDEERSRQAFENAPLLGHDGAIVHKLRRLRALRAAAGEFRNSFEMDVELIPE